MSQPRHAPRTPRAPGEDSADVLRRRAAQILPMVALLAPVALVATASLAQDRVPDVDPQELYAQEDDPPAGDDVYDEDYFDKFFDERYYDWWAEGGPDDGVDADNPSDYFDEDYWEQFYDAPPQGDVREYYFEPGYYEQFFGPYPEETYDWDVYREEVDWHDYPEYDYEDNPAKPFWENPFEQDWQFDQPPPPELVPPERERTQFYEDPSVRGRDELPLGPDEGAIDRDVRELPAGARRTRRDRDRARAQQPQPGARPQEATTPRAGARARTQRAEAEDEGPDVELGFGLRRLERDAVRAGAPDGVRARGWQPFMRYEVNLLGEVETVRRVTYEGERHYLIGLVWPDGTRELVDLGPLDPRRIGLRVGDPVRISGARAEAPGSLAEIVAEYVEVRGQGYSLER